PTHRRPPGWTGSATATTGVAHLAAGARQRGPDGSAAARLGPAAHQSRLQLEHGLLLVGVAVVVAQQVQDAVRAQQVQLGLDRVAGLARLAGGHLAAKDDVAEKGHRPRPLDTARAQTIAPLVW